MAVENSFGAVAVVGIEIPDRDARDTLGAGRNGGDSDLVQIAEAHRLVGGRVVSGWAHQAERSFALEGEFGGSQGGAHGPSGMRGNIREIRRVVVEIPGLKQPLQVGRRVGKQEGLIRYCDVRCAPVPSGVRGAQVLHATQHAGGLFRSHRGTVLSAARIVKDGHRELRFTRYDFRWKRRKRVELMAACHGIFFLCLLRLFAAILICMKVVVLCSGGMDSVTALYWARQEHAVVAVASFDYGSKHNHRELPLAAEHAAKFNLRHETISLDFVNRLFASDLLKSGGNVPEGHYEAENMKATVVPFRNAIMLSIACGLAESLNAEGLVIAAHGGDHAIYPDCREDFMRAMGDAMRLGTYAQVELLRPFIAMTKSQIAAEGAQLGVDFARTWSCYKGGAIHCGKCGTCVERREAFAQAGVKDPTVYASNDPLPSKPSAV